MLPAPKPGVRASFEKLRPRGVWDFAMASLAISLQLRDKTIDDARVVFGGIAGKPLRDTHRAICEREERKADDGSDGARRARTADLLGAIQALSQLSYSPARGTV